MSQNQYFLRPWSQMTQLFVATIPDTASHTGIPSPTSTIHVWDRSTTSTCHVEDQQPATRIHAGGITLFARSHTSITSPTSMYHVGDETPASVIQAESMSPALVSDNGGIHTIEKPRCVRRKPKFLCRICEGDHLTCMCPTTSRIPEVWSSPRGPSCFELSLVSIHFISPLIDMAVMPMQS
jgi:hypothetical protein